MGQRFVKINRSNSEKLQFTWGHLSILIQKNILSTFFPQGAKQRTLVAQRKTKTLLAVRKIRKYDEAFDPRTFVEEAQDVYIQAHKLLAW